MSLRGAGYIVGAWEHPTRKAPDKSVTLLHAECAKGALDDAGLTLQTIALSRPSLDDVFLRQTGRSLRETND